MPDAALLEIIASQLDDQLDLASVRITGGSSLNHTFCVDGRNARYFVKTNAADGTAMMAAECAGLQELSHAAAVRVPEPLAAGAAGAHSFIAMEWLDLCAVGQAVASRFGRELARLHDHTQTQFGWRRDNTIGLTPQINTPDSDWGRFFSTQRLGVQLELLGQQGIDQKLEAAGRKLQERLPDWFAGQAIRPALLHGDLWAGNWGALDDGTPVMFDPAVYYGDAESDIAMTQLFGGFDRQFYTAYREHHPDMEHGPERRKLYQLYHLLNHCNLFGRTYLARTGDVMRHLLSVIKP